MATAAICIVTGVVVPSCSTRAVSAAGFAPTTSPPPPAAAAGTVGGTCNATMYTGKSVGGNAYKQLEGSTNAACCAACVADRKCAAFVTAGGSGHGECLLKADLQNFHAKATNDCGIVRGAPGPPEPAPPPPPLPGPTPPLPPGSPHWEVVEAGAEPVIGPQHPDVLEHSIQSGFETGQFFRVNGTFYYTANELGTCAHPGILWDLVTRAALWSAQTSSGPWKRVLTLRNGTPPPLLPSQ